MFFIGFQAFIRIFALMDKNNITIPDHFPLQREEDQKVAQKRRETYSLKRDQQAREFNEAIATRLAKEEDEEKE